MYNGFILALPFRLRTGAFFSVHVGDFDVVFRNGVDIPTRKASDDISASVKQHSLRDKLFTVAMVLDRNPATTADFRERFVASIESSGDQETPDASPRYVEALRSLNDAIVGYHHATNILFGGTVVKRLTAPVFFDRLRYLHTIVCPFEYELSKADLVEILDARGGRQFTQQETLTGELDDVPAGQLADIQRYAELHQRFLFYQFALDAKSKMVEQDFVSAILFAVVALEGVHATLLQMRLNRRIAASITDPDVRAKQAAAIANKLLLKVGLSESLEMTSLLFLDAKDSPSEDEMQKCKLGITIRNDIMHALAKKGHYRLRNRTNQQICEAYSGVLKMFSRFAAIVERDTEAENTA